MDGNTYDFRIAVIIGTVVVLLGVCIAVPTAIYNYTYYKYECSKMKDK